MIGKTKYQNKMIKPVFKGQITNDWFGEFVVFPKINSISLKSPYFFEKLSRK